MSEASKSRQAAEKYKSKLKQTMSDHHKEENKMSILNLNSFRGLPVWITVLWIIALVMAISGLVIMFTEGGLNNGLALCVGSTLLNNFCLRNYKGNKNE